MEWLFTNWGLIAGALSAPLMYILGGRQARKIELKKLETDAVSSMQQLYNSFLDDFKTRMAEVMAELTEMKVQHKALQGQFNQMSLAYSKEVEVSQNWEKLHRELKKEYEALKYDHDMLKKDHELLKLEVQNNKNKIGKK